MQTGKTFVPLEQKDGYALLKTFKDSSDAVTVLELFPALDIREDQLVEMRGTFQVEVKLTKVEHPAHKRDNGKKQNFSRRYSTKDGPSFRSSSKKGARPPSKERRDRPARGDSRNGNGPNKPDRKPKNTRSGNSRANEEVYYVRKADPNEPSEPKQPKETPKGEKDRSRDPKPKQTQGKASRRKPDRKYSEEYEWVEKKPAASDNQPSNAPQNPPATTQNA